MADNNLGGSLGSGGAFPFLGEKDVTITGNVDLTLTLTQYSNQYLRVLSDGTSTGVRSVIVPLVKGTTFVVQNATTEGFAVNVRGVTGSGSLIPPNTALFVSTDGVNYSIIGGASSGATALIVANVAALEASVVTGLLAGTTAYVQSVGAFWTLQTASTLAVDNITVASSPTSGVQWLRGTSGVIEAALVQTAWFVDRQNVSGTASDENTGLTSGTALRTKAEIMRRWGTWSPTLNNVQVVITYLSSDTDSNDPGLFSPNFVESASLLHTAALPATSFTGTLNVVTSKNVVGNQALLSTFNTTTGAIAASLLLVNTTRGNSRAFVYRNTAGSTWMLSQPLAPYVMGTSITQTEVDTWVAGDTILGYAPLVVDLCTLGGKVLSPATASVSNPRHVAQLLTIPTFSGEFKQFFVDTGAAPSLFDCAINKFLSVGGITSFVSIVCVQGCAVNTNSGGQSSFAVEFQGGYLGPFSHNYTGGIDSVILGSDVIIGAPFNVSELSLFNNNVFIDSGKRINIHGNANIAGTSTFYGQGVINLQPPATCIYSGTAVSTFPLSGGLQIAFVATAYSSVTSGGVTSIHNLTLTAANLDAQAGPNGFGGLAYAGGGAFSQSGVQPVVNFLTQTAWFVDRQNVSGTASDSNTGLTSGTALRTKAEIIRRWGTNSPVLNGIAVKITYLSADTDGNDPGIFTPFFVGGATLVHTAALPTSSFTGSLLAVTAKNRAGNQALRSTFTTTTGAVVANMLLVNTTRGNSRAFAHRNTGGGLWQISQPQTPYSGTGMPANTEVDTWANGDSIIGYVLTNIDIPLMGGQSIETQASFAGGNHFIWQIAVLQPGTSFDPMIVDGRCNPSIIESVVSRTCTYSGDTLTTLGNLSNSSFASISAQGGFTQLTIAGGILGGLIQAHYDTSFTNDVIFAPTAVTTLYSCRFTVGVYSEVPITINGFLNCVSGVVHYGSGSVNVNSGGPVRYTGSAVSTFPLSGGLKINGLTTAYSLNNNTLNSNISITAANLDAPAGTTGFGGTALIPGGGSITNGVGTQSSALTQATWFIDPANSTGLASDSNSGLTALLPVLTWNGGVISKYGTNMPRITQATTYTFLSNGTAADSIDFFPTLVGSGGVFLVGTLVQLTTTTIGTFTAKNKTTGIRNTITASGQSGAYWTTYVGMSVHDTTSGAQFYVDADLGTATAAITEPVTLPIGSIPSFHAIANGDALTIYQPSTVYITRFDFTSFGNGGGGGVQIKQLSVNTELQCILGPSVFLIDCRFIGSEAICLERGNTGVGLTSSYFLSTSGFLGRVSIFAGSCCNGFSQLTNKSVLDADTIVHRIGSQIGWLSIGSAYMGVWVPTNNSSQYSLTTVNTGGFGTTAWGPATINAVQGQQVQVDGASATAALLCTGGLQIDGVTTSWVAGTNADSQLPVTVGNIDYYGGMFNKATNSRIFTANTASPISVLTQATWFIDPSNSSGLASDSNSGLTTLLPVRTWNGGVLAKYGTTSPRLRQNTVFTFLSSHTDNTDPVYFSPYIENSATVSIVGNLGAAQQIATGTLSNVTAKNRTVGSQTLLLAQSGATAINQLVVNSTNSSRAWTYAVSSGSIFKMTQPLVPPTLPQSFASPPAEVDTWASGNSVIVYAPVAVNIVSIQPTMTDLDQTSFQNLLYLRTLQIFSPASSNDTVLGSCVAAVECDLTTRKIVTPGTNPGSLSPSFTNNLYKHFVSGSATQPPYFFAGAVLGNGQGIVGYVAGIEADIVMGPAGCFVAIPPTNGTQVLGNIFIDSGVTFDLMSGGGDVKIGTSGFYGTGVLWGPGTLNISGTGRFRYAGTAVSVFTQTGMTINSSTTAFSSAGTNPVTFYGGITVTPANLDAAAGVSGFGGNAFNLGGACITNGGL